MVLLLMSLSSTAAGQVRISFLRDESVRRQTLELLAQNRFGKDSVRRFDLALARYYSSSFGTESSKFPANLSRFPALEGGFYWFGSVDEAAGLLDRPLSEADHAYECSCFDAVITLTTPQLESRIGLDDLAGPILVPHTTTNGAALTLPVATARDAFARAYPEWYRESSASAFPGSLATARIALTAAMFRVHLLRISTEEERLQSAVLESLRRDWRASRLRFPSQAQIVMCHLVCLPEQWFWTSHAGVLLHNGQGYTYLEKAGGTGPFVRIDLSGRAELMPWFTAMFKNAAPGYTHLFVTLNDTEIAGQKLRR